MLTLTRKIGESIRIGDEIQIVVKEIRKNQVRIGIIAPREIKIYREEVYQNIVAENREAAMANPEALDVVVSDLAPPDSDAPEEPERTPTTTRPSNGDQPHPDKGKKPRG
ncbi:MAG: carbon storage regulator [Myxococcales bacterium]|nr:carbon storage regulator [Myxococcales bacterium]